MNQPTELGAPVLKAIANGSDPHSYSGVTAEDVRGDIPSASIAGVISGLVRQDLVEVEEYRTGWGSEKGSADGDYLHLTDNGWDWYNAQ